MDDLDLRAAIDVATQEALEIANALSEYVLSLPVSRTPMNLALDLDEKLREVRRLRRALKVEVGG